MAFEEDNQMVFLEFFVQEATTDVKEVVEAC
jgi:hypothetical protein